MPAAYLALGDSEEYAWSKVSEYTFKKCESSLFEPKSNTEILILAPNDDIALGKDDSNTNPSEIPVTVEDNKVILNEEQYNALSFKVERSPSDQSVLKDNQNSESLVTYCLKHNKSNYNLCLSLTDAENNEYNEDGIYDEDGFVFIDNGSQSLFGWYEINLFNVNGNYTFDSSVRQYYIYSKDIHFIDGKFKTHTEKAYGCLHNNYETIRIFEKSDNDKKIYYIGYKGDNEIDVLSDCSEKQIKNKIISNSDIVISESSDYSDFESVDTDKIDIDLTKTDYGYQANLSYDNHDFAEIRVNVKSIISIIPEKSCGKIFVGAGKNDNTDVNATINYSDGTNEIKTVSLGMLTNNGTFIDATQSGEYQSIDITYGGFTQKNCFDLNVVDRSDFAFNWFDAKAQSGYIFEPVTGEIDSKSEYIIVDETSSYALDVSSVLKDSDEYSNVKAYPVIKSNDNILVNANDVSKLSFSFSDASAHSGIENVEALDINGNDITENTVKFLQNKDGYALSLLSNISGDSLSSFKLVPANSAKTALGFSVIENSNVKGEYELLRYSDILSEKDDNYFCAVTDNICFDSDNSKWYIESEESTPVKSESQVKTTYSYVLSSAPENGKKYVITTSKAEGEKNSIAISNGNLVNSPVKVTNVTENEISTTILDDKADYSNQLWTVNKIDDEYTLLCNGKYISYDSENSCFSLSLNNPVWFSYSTYTNAKISETAKHLGYSTTDNIWKPFSASTYRTYYFEQIEEKKTDETPITVQYVNDNHNYIRLYKKSDECEMPTGGYTLIGASDKTVEAFGTDDSIISQLKNEISVFFSEDKDIENSTNVTENCVVSIVRNQNELIAEISIDDIIIGNVSYTLYEWENEIIDNEPVYGEPGFVECTKSVLLNGDVANVTVTVNGCCDDNSVAAYNTSYYDVIGQGFSLCTDNLPENVIVNNSLKPQMVDTDDDKDADFSMASGSLYWKIGELSGPISMTYQIQFEEDFDEITYSEKTELYYRDSKGNSKAKQVITPCYTENGSVKSYIYYLTDSVGNPLSSNSNDAVTDYLHAYKIMGPIKGESDFDISSVLPDYVNINGDETENGNFVYVPVSVDIGAHNDTVVIDYGLPVKILPIANDYFDTKYEITGVSDESIDFISGKRYDISLIDTCNELELSFGNVKLNSNEFVFTPTDLCMKSFDRFVYEIKTSTGYYYANVTVIPANNVYAEEDFFSLTGDWQTIGSAPSAFQAQDIPGFTTVSKYDANNAYGSDRAYDNEKEITYSLNSAIKATVSAESPSGPTASFYFTGTKFELFCSTSSSTGFVFVRVLKDGVRVKNYGVNTYYQSEDLLNIGNELYQIPVIASDELEYGTYEVVVEPYYNSYFDSAESGEYSVILDAIRIYNPCGNDPDSEIKSAYKSDLEYNASYTKVRDELLSAENAFDFSALPQTIINDESYVAGGLFVSTSQSLEMSDWDAFKENYKISGPNNEVYLAKGQAIAFYITASTSQTPKNVSIGMKVAGGADADGSVVIMNTTTKKPIVIGVKGATTQYKSIRNVLSWTESNDSLISKEPIIVYNNSDSLISLTNLRWSFGESQEQTSAPKLSMMSTRRMMSTALISLRNIEQTESTQDQNEVVDLGNKNDKIISFKDFVLILFSYLKSIFSKIFT